MTPPATSRFERLLVWLALLVGLLVVVFAGSGLVREILPMGDGRWRELLLAGGFLAGLVAIQLSWSRLLRLDR